MPEQKETPRFEAVELSTGQTNTAELEYYGNPWDLARPSGEPPCEFRFPREVEYVFHVSHMSKHYRGPASRWCSIVRSPG